MSLEKDVLGEYWSPAVSHPMIDEADYGWRVDQGVILDPRLLRRYLENIIRWHPSELLKSRAEWILDLFPVVKGAGNLPEIWKYEDLVKTANNIGSIEQARIKVQEWTVSDYPTAYWIGGLEFTPAQCQAAIWLFEKGNRVIMGVEPCCYPMEARKNRGDLVSHIVPTTLWSMLLNRHGPDAGFIFEIPRPRPETELQAFYTRLYQKVTGGKIFQVVVSGKDEFESSKRQRGPVIEVPSFPGPSTSEYYHSY